MKSTKEKKPYKYASEVEKEQAIIKKLRKLAKDSFGLNLSNNEKTPPVKPRTCDMCSKKRILCLFYSRLEGHYFWACKGCEGRANYDFYYRLKNQPNSSKEYKK